MNITGIYEKWHAELADRGAELATEMDRTKAEIEEEHARRDVYDLLNTKISPVWLETSDERLAVLEDKARSVIDELTDVRRIRETLDELLVRK